ncbi:MAG: hypothetical protein PCFJNLEI_04096 [Verrucomicrobiae bacterium]|nr:hypothetical protein [Verrucomicrobiae bacterium]
MEIRYPFMTFWFLGSAVISLLMLTGSLILLRRRRTWPEMLLVFGSLLTVSTVLMHLVHLVCDIPSGSSLLGYFRAAGYISGAGGALFSVGFLSYALRHK